MKRYIIMDLDGTLADCAHRVHWAQVQEWDQFHAGISEDTLIHDTAEFVKAMERAAFNVIICTGRPEKYRMATDKWLFANGIGPWIELLLMRPDNDWSPDIELKIKLVDEHFGSREAALASVLVVLDDRNKMVEAWRSAGFRCWQVQVGMY